MFAENKAVIIRRELIRSIVQLFFNDQLSEHADRIAIKMFPKYAGSTRCCIYKARAIIKYRLIALFGFSDEDETDELETLSSYLSKALMRTEIKHPLLTVIDEACSSCVKVNYFATNACRGCVARPCMVACNKDAIDVIHSQSVINHEKCVNCGKCMKVCPYHAIIYIPVPCEEACPVNAITKDENQKESIDFNLCIYCGKCVNKCPFGAIMEKSQLIDVLSNIKKGPKVIALIAPSAIAHLTGNIGQIKNAIKKLGFSDVFEVAMGADLTSENEAKEFEERMSKNEKFMTSSCCYSYIELINKHVPELMPYFSTTKTPMQFTAELVKQNNPDAKIVFISPCVSKKSEALKSGVVDYVLNIEEIGSMLEAFAIDACLEINCEDDKSATIRGRGFPVSGGIADAIKSFTGDSLKASLISGIDRKTLSELRNAVKNAAKKDTGFNFIEVMSCEGGCINGPCVINNSTLATRQFNNFVGKL